MLSRGPRIATPDQSREGKPTRRRRKATGAASRKVRNPESIWDLWARFGSDWLFGLAEDGSIVWASLAAQANFGTKLVGSKATEMFQLSDAGAQDLLGILAAKPAKGPISWQGERKAKEGELQPGNMETLIFPATDSKTRAARILLVRQAAAATSNFAAGAIIAHEITQPLTATLTHLQVFRRLTQGKRVGNKDAGQAIDGAIRSAERAAETLERMREWSKGHALPRSVEDVNELLRQAVELLQPELTAQQVELKWEIEHLLHPVLVNAGAVVQVAANLIRNALEAMHGLPADRQKLVLLAKNTGGFVEVGVQDAGRGVSIAMVQRLFEPYQSTKSSGAGLGLALSRTLIETMGGFIRGRPSPEHGYTFFFTLPKAPTEP